MENLIFLVIILIVIYLIYWIHTTAPTNTQLTQLTQSEKKENFDVFANQDNLSQCAEKGAGQGTGHGDLLTLNPFSRCNVLGVKKFMIRDLRTKLWLTSGQEEGFNKFLPGRFGIPLVMSDNPSEYLPLRTVADPNDYLLATYKGDGIRTVSNPYNKYFVLQVFIYEGFNVLGWIDEAEQQKYLYIDNDGHISSTNKPEESSVIEIVEI